MIQQLVLVKIKPIKTHTKIKSKENSMLKIGSRWYSKDMQVFSVQEIWYKDNYDLWVRYSNSTGQDFTCRAEAFVNRFSYSDAQ